MAIDMVFNEVLHKADQALEGELPQLPADFGFRWAGIDFNAMLESVPEGSGEMAHGTHANAAFYRLTLESPLGHIPYSAEDLAARRGIRELLSAPVREIGTRFEVSRQGKVAMVATTDFPAPLSADSLMQALAISLLHLRPALTRLRGLLLRGRANGRGNGNGLAQGVDGS